MPDITKEHLDLLAAWVQAIGLLLATVSALLAVFQYRRSVRQRVAESLMEMEKRFRDLKDVTVLIDPANIHLYRAKLQPMVLKAISTPPIERIEEEEWRLAELDQFLRFLLLLSVMEKHVLLNRRALATMYHYWFSAVWQNPNLKAYVAKYFPKLDRFLVKNHKSFLQESAGRPY